MGVVSGNSRRKERTTIVSRSSTPVATVGGPKRRAAGDDGHHATHRASSRRPKKRLSAKERWKKIGVWAFWIGMIVLLYFSYGWLTTQAVALLQVNPTVWSWYLAIQDEIASHTLRGLFYAASFGSFILFALPIEILYLYYLGLGYQLPSVVLVSLAGIVLGTVLNYALGALIGSKPLKWFIKDEEYASFHRRIERAGGFLVALGNIIPFPIDLLGVFLGAVRFGLVKLLLYTLLGRLVQFFILWLGYKYFILYVGPYLSTVSVPWLLDLVRNSFV